MRKPSYKKHLRDTRRKVRRNGIDRIINEFVYKGFEFIRFNCQGKMIIPKSQNETTKV